MDVEGASRQGTCVLRTRQRLSGAPNPEKLHDGRMDVHVTLERSHAFLSDRTHICIGFSNLKNVG
jgi:hypothetical protein